jgi:hypothetical protein
VAVSAAGLRATFNPSSPAFATTASIDASQPAGLSCPSSTYCLAIDRAGHAVEFDPGGTGATVVESVGSGGTLNGVACVSAGECVAVDSTGRAFLGAGAVPPPPASLSRPAITGSTREEKTLEETHGRWSQTPTSYTYQWQRCAKAGSCAPIPGAVQPSYTLVAADAGHLIRVTEQAADAGGVGPVVTSGETARVSGLPAAPAFSRVSLSGLAHGHPRLAFTLTAARYGPPLRTLTLTLPQGLGARLRRQGPPRHRYWAGIALSVRGKPPAFSARLVRGALRLTLARSASPVRISIGALALRATASLERDVRRHKTKQLALTVAVPAAGKATLRATDQIRLRYA